MTALLCCLFEISKLIFLHLFRSECRRQQLVLFGDSFQFLSVHYYHLIFFYLVFIILALSLSFSQPPLSPPLPPLLSAPLLIALVTLLCRAKNEFRFVCWAICSAFFIPFLSFFLLFFLRLVPLVQVYLLSFVFLLLFFIFVILLSVRLPFDFPLCCLRWSSFCFSISWSLHFRLCGTSFSGVQLWMNPDKWTASLHTHTLTHTKVKKSTG